MSPELYRQKFAAIAEYIKHVRNKSNSVQRGEFILGLAPPGAPLVAQPGLGYQKKAGGATKMLPMFKKYTKTDTKQPKMRITNAKVRSWRAQDSIALRGPIKEDRETAHPRMDVMPHSRRLDQACWKHHLWEFDRNRDHQLAPNMQLPMDAYCVMSIVWVAGPKKSCRVL